MLKLVELSCMVKGLGKCKQCSLFLSFVLLVVITSTMWNKHENEMLSLYNITNVPK